MAHHAVYVKMKKMVDDNAAVDAEQQRRAEGMEMPVKLYYCNDPTCKLKGKWRESQSQYCYENGHAKTTKDVIRRSFRCAVCKTITKCYNQALPLCTCKCSSSRGTAPEWVQISDYEARGKINTNSGLGRQGMTISGTDGKFFLRADDMMGPVPTYVDSNEQENNK